MNWIRNLRFHWSFLLLALVICCLVLIWPTHQVSAQQAIDPCQAPGYLKTEAAATITTATTTQLIALSAGTFIYVCGFVVNMTGTVTADTLQFEQGTGASCATNTFVLGPVFNSGVLSNGATDIVYGPGSTLIQTTVSGRALCAVSTVGTGPSIAVQINYVQQ
jgi:hypothetical protein